MAIAVRYGRTAHLAISKGKRVEKQARRIGVVAPSSPFARDTAERVLVLAKELFGGEAPEIVFHPQCFERNHHFAGTDASRAAAFLEFANDPDLDAIWFARGGYGACRIAHQVLPKLAPTARAKTYLGYSDAGTLLAGLYKAGCTVAHGPMCHDIVREGGDAAVTRALRWLVERDAAALEPNLDPETPVAAFNMMVLSQIIATDLQPDLTGHVLLLEEVSEQLYRIDRTMHHILAAKTLGPLAGIRLGRCSNIIENDPDFGDSPEEIARHWCVMFGVPFLGAANIGHDAANRVVPFGMRADTAKL